MRRPLHTFGAASLRSTHQDDTVLERFHERVHLATHGLGASSHIGLGVVVWTAEDLTGALDAAKEILAHVPEASITLAQGEPTLTTPSLNALPVGALADLTLEQCRGADVGALVLHRSVLDALPGRALGEMGFTSDASPSSRWTTWFVSGVSLVSPQTAGPAWSSDDAWEALCVDARAQAALELVEQGIDDLTSGRSLERLATMEDHAERILEAVSFTAGSDLESCARLLVALAKWLNPIWMAPEVVTACDALVEAWPLASADADTLQIRADLHVLRAHQLRKRREFASARRMLDAVVAATSSLPTTRARALNGLALLATVSREVDLATSIYQEVLDTFGDDAALAVVAQAHRGLAVAALARKGRVTDHYDDSFVLRHLERAIDIGHACHDRQTAMLATGSWSNLLSMSDPERAIERTTSVIDLARALRAHRFVTVSVCVLIDIAIRRGRMIEARALLARARDVLTEDDQVGRWFVLHKEAFICLYEGDYDSASELAHTLRQEAVLLNHPQFPGMVDMLDVYGALLDGRYGQFAFLCETIAPAERPFLPLLRALAALAQADDTSMEAAESHVEELLSRAESESLHDEWSDLAWRHAIALRPERFTAARRRPTIAVASDIGWFVDTDGVRHELSHRPSLHRLFESFVEVYRSEGTPFDTQGLFDRGWPGERITFETMRNRVYVSISKLRSFGLRPWLVRGPHGYAFTSDLSIVVLGGSSA